MSACVVDASVAIKWYVPEAHSEKALRLLALQQAGSLSLHVPDLFVSESGNILWKKVRTGELERPEAQRIAQALLAVPKVVHPAGALLPSALNLACSLGRTVYDSLYLALAASLDCGVVTADRRLWNALNGTPWQGFVRWVEDV